MNEDDTTSFRRIFVKIMMQDVSSDPMANRMRQLTPATGARIVVCRPRRVNTGGIPLVADEMTVGRRLPHLVTVGTHHGADAMTAGRHLHLALAETSIDGMTVELFTAVIVASHHPPPGGLVVAVTRSRGRHLASARVLCHAERAHRTGTVLVTTTIEEMVHGTDIGTVGVDEEMCIPWEYLFYVSASCPSVLYVYHLKILPHLRALLYCGI